MLFMGDVCGSDYTNWSEMLTCFCHLIQIFLSSAMLPVAILHNGQCHKPQCRAPKSKDIADMTVINAEQKK